MSKYTVWIIADSGNGICQRFTEWDGEEELRLHTAPFKDDVVIAIEPINETNEDDVSARQRASANAVKGTWKP